MPNYIKIEWTNSKDIGDLIYQNGFTNCLYFEAFLDYPEPVREEEILNNGFGAAEQKFSEVKQKCLFEIDAVSDDLFWSLFVIREHDTITITEYKEDQIRAITATEFLVSRIDRNDGCTSVARVEFTQLSLLKTGCLENKIIV